MKKLFLLTILGFYLIYILCGALVFTLGAEPVFAKNSQQFVSFEKALKNK